MCGIVGFAGPGGEASLGAMTQSLAHRGPDGKGAFADAERQLYLGHTRLAVIDPAHGHQPMWDAEKRVGVIFNGEIYNHAELRETLEARGHRFATDHCDTEVLIHGYREWGEELLPRLNGMFAFCLFDRAAGQLFLARDRMGEKPLYTFFNGTLFAFASEPHALFEHEDISCELDPHGVQKYFAYGYAPGESTVFKGVRKLPPGTSLRFDIASMEPKLKAYYRFRIEPDAALARRPAGELAEQLRELILRATRLRLEADVPLGLFLSGGIDSSAILAGACAARQANTVDAFTMGFDDESFDESAFGARAAEHFGCRHHLRGFALGDAKALIPQVLAHLGEPFGDPSVLPTSMLSAFARENVTVALSGDGGDELFAGYDPLLALRPARIYSRFVPSFAHRVFRAAARRLPVSDRNMSFEFRLKRMLLGLGYPAPVRLPVWMSAIEPDAMADFFADALSQEELYSEAIEVWEENESGCDIDRALEFFTRLYLPDDILLKTDRASMMHSLEVRAVFLDNEIVDFARRLPAGLKLRRGRRKWLLKEALRGLLPAELIERRKKGFGIPLTRWLRSMSPPPVRTGTLMRSEAVAARWRAHGEKRSDERLLLWAWVSLQTAANACGDGAGRTGDQLL